MGCNCGGGRSFSPPMSAPQTSTTYTPQSPSSSPGYAQASNPNSPQPAQTPPAPRTRRTI